MTNTVSTNPIAGFFQKWFVKDEPTTTPDEAVEPPITAEERAAWLRAAHEAVQVVSKTLPQFTSDDIHQYIRKHAPEARIHDARSLGTILREAYREGLIIPTGEFQMSSRPSAHRNPKRVWVAAP